MKANTDAKVLKANILLIWTGPCKVLAVGPGSSADTPDGTLRKLLGHGTRKIKSNALEPQFPTSATKSRCLEDTKTAAALTYCSESIKESIARWWTFELVVRLELERNYGTSCVQKRR